MLARASTGCSSRDCWAARNCQFQPLLYSTRCLIIVTPPYMACRGSTLGYPCHLLVFTASCLHHKIRVQTVYRENRQGQKTPSKRSDVLNWVQELTEGTGNVSRSCTKYMCSVHNNCHNTGPCFHLCEGLHCGTHLWCWLRLCKEDLKAYALCLFILYLPPYILRVQYSHWSLTIQSTSNEVEYPETQRQATQHACLPRLLGAGD